MYIKWLKAKNFRNYIALGVEFSQGINLISGQNGQGKTNLVEAVMLLALTKSPRTHTDADMKKDGTSFAESEALVSRNFGTLTLRATISDEEHKTFFVNGNETDKVSDVFGNLVAVYFSPDDLKIVSESPNERREFMDTDISQISGGYYKLICRYQKVLFQRNRLLKTIKSKSELAGQIEVWDEQLSTLAGHIVKTRKSFIKKLKVHASDILKFFTKNADELDMEYVGVRGETFEQIKSEVAESLRFNLDRDMELGYTTIGPHRDDIKFTINKKDAKVFASQGQQRSIVLALKVAELKVFEEELGEKPILVLDDVFSELDSSRQRRLFEMFKGCQVLMTGTTFRFKPDEEYKSFVVKNAVIKEKTVPTKDPAEKGGATAAKSAK